MIMLLYEASKKGVRIRLLVRGICSLIPKVKGLSDNIEVKSIVGTFLEHSRVYIFENLGQKKVYISSADWMTRNLDRRIEVSLPIFDEEIAKKIIDYTELQWSDNVKSRLINETPQNKMFTEGDEIINSQEEIYIKLQNELKSL
jgi:polyphosphate kinase